LHFLDFTIFDFTILDFAIFDLPNPILHLFLYRCEDFHQLFYLIPQCSRFFFRQQSGPDKEIEPELSFVAFFNDNADFRIEFGIGPGPGSGTAICSNRRRTSD